MKKKTQADHVTEALAQEAVSKLYVEKVLVPGVELLHEKPFAEIAEVLTNVLRSRPNIQEVKWVIGECIEITGKDF